VQTNIDPNKSSRPKSRPKWAAIASAGLVVVAGLLYVGYLKFEADYKSRLWPEHVRDIYGLETGMSRSDVLFKKGVPTRQCKKRWFCYQESGFILAARLDTNDKVRSIWFIKDGDYNHRFLQRVGFGTSSSALIDKLGEPGSISTFENESGAVSREYSYLNTHGIYFILEKDSVTSIVVGY
jgi:hypothetical protein